MTTSRALVLWGTILAGLGCGSTGWDEYMEAYTDAIEKCSTDHAPWYVIPADRKWYRNWAISSIVRRELELMDPKPPAKPEELEGVTIE